MDGSMRWRCAAAAGAVLVVLAGCGPDEPRLDGPLPDTLPPTGEVSAHGAETGLDADTRLRHADALDGAVLRMRQHVAAMRALAPREAMPRLGDHAAQVESLVGEVQERMRELGAEADPARMEQVLGVRPDHQRVLGDQMQTSRAEARELVSASEAQVRERLPGHLDRLEQLLGTLESAAAHLRRG
jgi:hypothetical protein